MIPGGVNSPVRAFRAVGGDPPFIVRGQGSRVWDADGNEYLDYIGSWGPLILGHAAPSVVEAICSVARDGVSFGASTPAEADLGRYAKPQCLQETIAARSDAYDYRWKRTNPVPSNAPS